MNRTSNTIENTDAKPTTQPVFNYAQAAKRSSKILDQASQRPKSTSPNSAQQTITNPPVTSGNAANSRGKSTANVSVPINRGSNEAGTMAAKNNNPYPFKSHTNPPHSPTHTSLTSEPNRRSKRSSVQLPKAPPNRNQSPLQFGSINQSPQVTAQQPIPHNRKELSAVTPTEVTFGSISVDDTSSVPAQLDRSKSLSQPTHPAAETRAPQTSQPPSNHQYNQGHRPRPPFTKPNKHYPTSPLPHQQTGYSPPPTFGYPNNPYPYYPPYMSNVQVRPQSKAIRIVDPNTGAEVKTQTLLSSSPSSKESPSQEDKKQVENKDTPSHFEKKPTFETKSRAIPIIDPAIKERQEREKREREEAEVKAKEEALRLERETREKEEIERVEREKREKDEAERKVKEEAERKEREEAERIEQEKQKKEEAERKEKEETERKEKEEAERLAKEEADRLAKEETDRLSKEEEARKEVAEKEEKEEKERKEAETVANDPVSTEPVSTEPVSTESAAGEEDDASSKSKRAPIRLDLSAIPAHVLSETPVQSPAPVKAKLTKPMPKIDDFDSVNYPEHVSKAPQGANSGRRIRYEPEFLLAFQALCTETAADLSIFQNVGDDTYDRGSRGGMQRRQTSERGRPRTPGSPMEMFKHGSRDGRMDMGKFGGGRQMSHRSGSGSHGLPPPGSPGGMQREGSQGGRSRSGRGGKGRHQKEQQGGPTIPLDQVVPLEKSENRWVPISTTGTATVTDSDMIPQETIVRKVNALLNKLTLENFDSVSDQIWKYAEQSAKETDGQSLQTVIELMFNKACDEAAFASMWAQLSRRLIDNIKTRDDIQDVNHKDKHGNPVHGNALFRKYLLNRCQFGFERGWKSELPTNTETDSEIMMTDEYYAAVKAKRQGLGLVQFIGELFKLEMLTDRIMMDCMRRLLNDPGEEEIETMCKLLNTVGKRFETTSKTCKNYMDTYMTTIKEILKPEPDSPLVAVNTRLSSRVKFMLEDVVDLRKSGWKPRSGTQTGPTTLAKVREEAQKAKNDEKDAIKRSPSSRGSVPPPISRQGSHRGGGRSIQREDSKGSPLKPADGWNTVSSPSGSLRGRSGELGGFGKPDRSSKSRGDILSPTGSPFASLSRSPKSGDKGSPADSRGASPGPAMTNMFDALGDEESHEIETPTERKKLQLLPRGTAADGDKPGSPLSETSKPKLTPEQVERRAKETIKEYFNLKDKKELLECIKELDGEDERVIFASAILGYVENCKEGDIERLCTIIGLFYSEDLFERDVYIKAIQPFMELYEDLIIDVPQAPKRLAKLLVAMKVTPSDVIQKEAGDDSSRATKGLETEYEKALQATEQ